MDYIVKYIKTGQVETMSNHELFSKFSEELSMHLMKMKCVKQVTIMSQEYGKVLIRKEE